MRQALYTKRYDVASELLGTRRVVAARRAHLARRGGPARPARAGAGHAAHRQQPRALSARAPTSRSRARRGAPVVTGRAEIERGRLYFQGRTYVIQRGTLDFVNPRRLDPLFDIEAETRIRSYQRDPARLRHPRARDPDPHLRPAALLAADPGAARRAGRERGRQPHPDPGPPEPGPARRGGGGDPRRGPALGVGRARARGRAALRPQPLLDRPVAPARRGHHADGAGHRRQAAHPRPQRALLPGPARHRGAHPRRRVHPDRPLLAAPHPDRSRHRQDRESSGAGRSTCGSGSPADAGRRPPRPRPARAAREPSSSRGAESCARCGSRRSTRSGSFPSSAWCRGGRSTTRRFAARSS